MDATRTLILLLALVTLVACSQPALPTPLPTAVLPAAVSATPSPEGAATDDSSLPPTRDLATATPRPTSPAPARQATRTPTPVIAPILSIGSPAPGARLPLGGEVQVSGFTHSVPGMILQLGLTSHTGWAISAAMGDLQTGSWQGTLAIPSNVYGSAELTAALLDAGGGLLTSDTIPVFIELVEPRPESYLSLLRPPAGLVAAAGHALYFDGHLRSQTGGRMHVAVLMNDCQEEITGYTFTLNGSTFWQVYVLLPEDIEGPACAVVTKDEPGSEGWMAGQVPLTIYPRGDERGQSITFANPSAGQRVVGGQTINVSGVAYNAPGGQLNLNVMLENGRVLADTVVEADRNGFWEFEISLPPDGEGQTQVQASLGDPLSPAVTAQVIFNLVPVE